MSDLTNELKKSIKANQILLCKLSAPLSSLQKRAEAQKTKRQEKIEKMTGYRNVEEAREEFGMGWLTRKEFEEIQDIFETGISAVEDEKSAEEIAYEILLDFCKKLTNQENLLKLDLQTEENLHN